MQDSVFVDKLTGEQVRIINEDTNFYVLDNSVRIKKDIFSKKYNQNIEIDPNTFFKPNLSTNDPLLDIANKIKSIDSNKLSDAEDTSGTRVKYTPPVVLSDTSMSQSAIKQPQSEENIPLSSEERKRMLEEWRRTQPGAQIPEIQDKNWDDDKFLNGDKPIVTKEPEPKVDPIQMMFKVFKNNYSVKLNIEIDENIPNPAFIGMIQENVDADAVEYYTNLIFDKLLKDPSKLKTQIYDQLKSIIDKELGA